MRALSYQRSAFSILLSAFCLLPSAHSQVITTVAGTTWIFRGDGGPATAAPLGRSRGVAVDAAGNVYAADTANNLVVKISPSGVLTVVAGNGICCYSGDGGTATSASLNSPHSVALDAAGNLYIADFGNRLIRRVTPGGTITTVAGDASRPPGFSGDGGPATSAQLNLPAGVAVDGSGNIYIADTFNRRIRKVGLNGAITTVAGNGAVGFSGDGGPATGASLSEPHGLAVDAAGNLYIADRENQRVRKVSPAGIISTVAGNGAFDPLGDGGPATAAGVGMPSAVAVDAGGNLYIADAGHSRIRKVSAGGIITTVAGDGNATFAGDGGQASSASLNQPEGVAVDGAGNVFIGDTLNDRIRKISAAGIISTFGGNGSFKYSGDNGPATSAALHRPEGVAVDTAGNLYVADTASHRIRKVTAAGTITTMAGTGLRGKTGDGGPAANALLSFPSGLVTDTAGNLYFADTGNCRIRKISTGGTITTVAGSICGSALGDGAPATNAMFLRPTSVALDTSGNMYVADSENNRIRKVGTNGIITTVAGTGVVGFSGDNGPAISAALNLPSGVAGDAAGNLYIADSVNHRIRKVSSGGTITTIAGTGVQGLSGDNGPAINAALWQPMGVALDAPGNLYVADFGNRRIRRITPGGIISTVAGHVTAAPPGEGALATSFDLSPPVGVTLDAAGNLYIADSADRVRKVLATAPSFSVSPTQLTFSMPGVATQRITVSSAVAGLAWSAQASTQGSGNWLAVEPIAGSMPATISVVVNMANLAPGTYKGTITVQAPLASPSTVTVAVDLTIQQPPPAQLFVEPGSLTFEAGVGGGPQTRALRIINAGGGALDWTATAEAAGGGTWLSLSPASGSAADGSPGTVQVTADVTGLQAGVYSGSIKVESSTTKETKLIPVTLLLSEVTQTILVSQSGLLFIGVEGGGTVPSQDFGILNTGQGAMNWTVQASTLFGGNWLTASPSSGQSTANSLEVPLVTVGANVTGLRSGQYGGQIRVEATTANNSPQTVTAFLNVLPAGSNPGVLVRPTGLIFAARAGSTSPGSQKVNLSTATPSSVEARGGLLTFDGGNWVDVVPRNILVSPTSYGTITIQPTLGSLAAGVYRGALTLLFDDGSPAQVVNILFVVVPASTASPAGLLGAGDCVPKRLLGIHRSLGSSFSSSVGWPSNIEAQVVDDCGSAVTNATVVAGFSNGDPPLPLASLRNGIYVGTWRPTNTSSGQITVTLRASLSPLQQAEVQVQGRVNANPNAPALFSGGIVNAASFAAGGALAPGSIVSVFGRKLAASTSGASTVPLPTTLGGATLSIGGRDVPLFYSSDGQVNAQLPFELSPNSRPQVMVKTSGDGAGTSAITVPETITIAAARPGIFATNQQGSGQGAILDTQNRLVDSSAPAAEGEVVQVFATGLGATQPAVKSGEKAPDKEPLARVTTTVTATVGGQTATVQFAGLAPGFVGLYQVNVQIPAGVTAGSAVSLVILQGGVPSNTVTLAVR